MSEGDDGRGGLSKAAQEFLRSFLAQCEGLPPADKAYVAAKVIEETARSLSEDEGLSELERARMRRDLQKTRELLFQLHSKVRRGEW